MDIIGYPVGNVRSLKTINVLKYVLAIQRLLFVWTVLFIIRRLVQRNQSIYRLRQSEQTVVYQIGQRKRETEFGSYNIYDVERSLCDIRRLEPENSFEIMDYVKESEQQYKRLMKYAELFGIKQF